MYGAEVDSSPFSFVCLKVHLMRPQTQTDHNENLWILRTVAPVHLDNFWIITNLQNEFGHTGRIVWFTACNINNQTQGAKVF